MSDNETCPICKDIFKSGNANVCHTSCGHKFHTECLMKIQNRNCPLCRTTLIEESELEVIFHIETTIEERTLILFEKSIALRKIYSDRFSNYSEKSKKTLEELINLSTNIHYNEYIEIANPIILADKKKRLTPKLIGIKNELELILGQNNKYIFVNSDQLNTENLIIQFIRNLDCDFSFKNSLTKIIYLLKDKNYEEIKDFHLNDNEDSFLLNVLNWIKLTVKKFNSNVNACST